MTSLIRSVLMPSRPSNDFVEGLWWFEWGPTSEFAPSIPTNYVTMSAFHTHQLCHNEIYQEACRPGKIHWSAVHTSLNLMTSCDHRCSKHLTFFFQKVVSPHAAKSQPPRRWFAGPQSLDSSSVSVLCLVFWKGVITELWLTVELNSLMRIRAFVVQV